MPLAPPPTIFAGVMSKAIANPAKGGPEEEINFHDEPLCNVGWHLRSTTSIKGLPDGAGVFDELFKVGEHQGA